MVKVSTLFYILDDTEEANEEIFDMEDIGGEKNGFSDVSNFLDRFDLEVDQKIVSQLFNTLMLL